MPTDLIRFGDFELDRAAYELRREGAVVPIQRIPLDLLSLLLERRGQLVTREEILERVWGKGFFVDSENSINTAIRKVRRALGDDPDEPRFVATVPARGYRFIGKISGQLTATGARAASSMVGRDRELATLCGGLDDAIAGRGRLFLISGEAGIGKTRLVNEVAQQASTKGIALLTGHCSEHAEAVAYLPFVEILENFVDRVSSTDNLRAALGDQGPELARLLPKLRTMLPELRMPIDLPPEQARRQLFNAFCDVAGRIASERPTLMIVEDLHWADDSTLSLLDHLTRRLSALSLIVVGTHRDAASDLSPAFATMLDDLHRERLASRAALKRLAPEEVAAMLANLSGKPPPVSMVSELYAETEGNPFLVEELFHHLDEEKRLYDLSGQFRAELKIAELDAPPSVRLVVSRRLGRLDEKTQQTLALAATIGRIFSFDLLQVSSAEDPNTLLDRIAEAEMAGLITSAPGSPGNRFQFSHELIRQGVVGSLTAARRQRLNQQVAEAIEQSYAAALDDYYGELAYHYRLGGNPAKAVDCTALAAERAAARSAPQQAIALAMSGLKLLAEMPHDEAHDRRELALQMTLGNCAGITRGQGTPEVELAFARALELCGRMNRTPEAIGAMIGLYTHYSRNDVRRASALEAQLLDLVTSITDPRLLARIHFSIGYRLMYHGDFERARYHLGQSMQFSEGRRLHVHACAALALTMWSLGYPAQAQGLIDQAETEARCFPDPFAQVMVIDNACMISKSGKDPVRSKLLASQITEISATYGFGSETVFASIIHAWADGCAGDAQGPERVRRSLAEFTRVHGELSRSSTFALIAELCLKFGRVADAIEAVDEALKIMERTGEGFAESELYRLRAQAELQLGPSHAADAIKWFERSIDKARRRSARIDELRATTNLAQVLASQDRNSARAMLAEIYNWFTEGFDTFDLKNAKALLDELTVNS